jgi:hypothetical protein
MKFQRNRWYMTRGGRPAFVVRDDNTTYLDKLPLVTVIHTPDHPHFDWEPCTANLDGITYPGFSHHMDLIEGEIEAPTDERPDPKAYVEHM